MRWLKSEYILKGIYLGLLLFVATQEPSWQRVWVPTLCALAGLGAALVVAAGIKLAQGFHVHRRFLGFLLFLLLESPTLVYLGILAGTGVGAYLIAKPDQADPEMLIKMVLGGGVLGAVLGLLRDIRDRRTRLGVCLLLGAALVVGAFFLFGYEGEFFGLEMSAHGPIDLARADLFGVQILLGIPIFYLLTFAGREEESEAEIGVLCAALGLGLAMVTQNLSQRYLQSVPFAIPVLLYIFYTWRVLPGLRVFKYSLRGYSYARIGRYRQALFAFRRALQLDPNNTLAREGFWGVHRELDPVQLATDPQTLDLVDFDLCLGRAEALLAQAPGPARLDEARRLLHLVEAHRPDMSPKVCYYRAVAHLHCREYDDAARELTHALDRDQWPPNDPQRRAVLLKAWLLAVLWHDEMRQRVGQPQLALPGRRIEAIAAVERHLAQFPEDADAWNLKRLLYHELTEAEYETVAGPQQALPAFDHAFVHQLGQALVTDPNRWQRGAEYLRVAARGLPESGPTIFVQIAQAHDRAGDPDGAWRNYYLARAAGLSAGHKNLTEADRQAYFAVLKMLGDEAHAQGNYDEAIENYRLYSESDRSGLETMRVLAQLHELHGDPLAALHFTELGLVYNGSDKDLLERRDRYYISVTPDDLRTRLDSYGGGFDPEYCFRKAKSLLDFRDADIEVLDWARHLIELSLVMKPNSIRAQVLLARAQLRMGQRNEGLAVLQHLHANRPEKFATGEDEDAWFLACQLLGRLYLDELARPDLAVPCFNDFRKSAKSGADTLYRLGQAYEQLGDQVKAKKCYENVAAYDGHPLVYDAREAIHRLQANQA